MIDAKQSKRRVTDRTGLVHVVIDEGETVLTACNNSYTIGSGGVRPWTIVPRDAHEICIICKRRSEASV